MHHLTTLDLPTPSAKEADRQWLAAKLAEAGVEQVTVIEPIRPRPLESHQWTGKDMTIITAARREEQSQKAARKAGRPHGTADDSHLVERAKAMADLGLSRFAASRALKIGCDRLARIEQAHNITFAKSA